MTAFFVFTIAAPVVILAYALFMLWKAHKPWDGDRRSGVERRGR